MGDFANYAKQGPAPGKTVPHVVTELLNADGSHPIVHVEYIGRSNPSYLEEVLAAAKTEEPARTTTAERLAHSRDIVIKHSARRLENVFFSDGTRATDADLPAFIRAMPLAAFERLTSTAINESNYCEYPIAAKPAELAEK